ncbi:hypothetical protein [Mesoplasma whartonense]|uniref:hypothetical protein n=1 Tax=Mesoplasma whartonense TaxID=2878854 RepID=UPI002022AA63|nr:MULTISPECIES: hypothetical protein [unclassified Mesoplasma]
MNNLEFKDLKPSEDNFDFTIEVLEQVFLEKLKKPFSSKAMFKILSGSKGFGKSYLICLLAWFFTCNFEDYNVQLSKYTFKSARKSWYNNMTKVANNLAEYGVRIRDSIGTDRAAKIRSYDSENRCEWIFSNNRMIQVIGFDNTSQWEGVPAKIGEWGMFAIDEVIPLKDRILDDEEYLYQLFNIVIQIVRGRGLTTSDLDLPELCSGDLQLHKQHLVIFGFNNHSTSHPIYQTFVNAIIPLTNQVKQDLEINAVSYEEDPDFLNVGAIVVRGTTRINEKNLNKKLIELGSGIKEKYPEIYETLFLGGEHDLNVNKYSYRKDLLENAQFFDPEQFFWENPGRFWFDEIRVGSDYADGGELGDDAVTILLAYEFDFEGYIKAIYVCEELSISTRKYKNMTDKVGDIADHLYQWSKKYCSTSNKTFLENNLKFRIGHDSRTIKDFLKEILANKYNFNRTMMDSNFSTFKATGSKGWKIEARHYTWKRLLSEKKLYFSKNLVVKQEINGVEVEIKPYGYLYDELYRCVNHFDKNIRDERPKVNKLDTINAAEHCLSFFRGALFKS